MADRSAGWAYIPGGAAFDGRRRWTVWRSRRFGLLVTDVVVAGLLAIVAVSNAFLLDDGVVGDGVDLYGTIWFFGWIADCIASFADPSFTDRMFHPLGKDIFAHTGNNFVDAIMAAPLVWVFGTPGWQPWAIAVILFGNGLTIRPLLVHLLGESWIVTLGVALWVVQPFALFESLAGRPTQAMLWFPSLAILGFRWTLEDGPRANRGVVLLGLMTGLAGWTYWFGGLFLGFTLCWLGGVALVQRRAVPRLWLMGRWALAATLTAVLVGPALIAISGTSSGMPEDNGDFFDLPRTVGNNVGPTLHGLHLMEMHGQPLLSTLVAASLGVLGVLWGRERWSWLGTAGLLAVLGLGPVVALGKMGNLVLPPYIVLYRLLPYFDRLWFPYRMAGLAGFALLICGMIALYQIHTRHRKTAVVVGIVLFVLAVVEQNRNLAFPMVARSLGIPGVYAELAKRGGGLVELPLGIARISIAHQAAHRIPTFGGMGENATFFWPSGHAQRVRNPFIRFLRLAVEDPGQGHPFTPEHLKRVRGWGMRWVVLDRATAEANVAHTPAGDTNAKGGIVVSASVVPQMTRELVGALGQPVGIDAALVVWDLSCHNPLPDDVLPCAPLDAPYVPDETSLYGHPWKSTSRPAFEQHLIDKGRLPSD
jgi:hypothetical protein